MPNIVENTLIMEHQLGFREEYSTVDQIHRITNVINKSLESKVFCSGVFLDVFQAFDKVWHLGLLYKIKKVCHIIFTILHSTSQCFNSSSATSPLLSVGSGEPQGSDLYPLLYLLFTLDLSSGSEITVATYSDDTAMVATHSDP